MMFNDMETTLNTLKEFALKYGGKLLFCLIVFLIGRILCKALIKITKKGMNKAGTGEGVINLVTILIKAVFYIVIALVVLDAFDVPTTSFVALFSAIGLAISLAVKDTLANFAEGLMLLITKPFKLGDYIETEGVQGTVQRIELVYTRLLTVDNKVVLIPNGEISGARITNYSAEPTRRLDLVFSIGYSDDIDRAKQVIEQIVDNHPYALKEPAPFIRVIEHGASSIDIAARIWVATEHYWDLNFDMKEMVKAEFDRHGINIPYPHMDINILKNGTDH